FDGMNLVAKEGPALNENDGVLLLSRNAGAFAELGGDALPVDPLDVAGTADAIHDALSLDHGARATRARALRDAATAMTPAEWVGRQLEDLAQA
ncbi:MAG TPA: trehalose-6-phosphate synthase, partial [Actinomycetota bacterium]|nr:trehalose-6-phosphate synthase [Actinomycetota bacterium]